MSAWLSAAPDRAPAERADAPTYEFAGYLKADGEHLFSLTLDHQKQRRTSHWLRLKDQFVDVTIVRFDPADEVLWVAQGNGVESPLKLRKGIVTLGGKASLAGKATIKFDGKTRSIDLQVGVNEKVEIPMSENERGKVSLEVRVDRIDATAVMVQLYKVQYDQKGVVEYGLAGPIMKVREGQPFAIRAGDFEFGFKP